MAGNPQADTGHAPGFPVSCCPFPVSCSRSRRAFISFDAMFSLIPVLLMLFYALSAASSLSNDAEMRIGRQVAFDKLVSIADYIVKRGAARADSSGDGSAWAAYPNWIDEGALDGMDLASLSGKAGLRSLKISMDGPSEGEDNCIYRLVVTGPDRGRLRIRRLFVCGG